MKQLNIAFLEEVSHRLSIDGIFLSSPGYEILSPRDNGFLHYLPIEWISLSNHLAPYHLPQRRDYDKIGDRERTHRPTY